MQKIQWETTLIIYYLALYQQFPKSGDADYITKIYTVNGGAASGPISFDWTVSTGGASLAASPIFYLSLMSSNSSDGFTCGYFNITAAGSASSSATTSTSSNPTTTKGSTTSSSSPSANSSPPSTSSTGLKVGLGVGLGIGIPLLIIAGVWLGLSIRKERSGSPSRNAPVEISQVYPHRYGSGVDGSAADTTAKYSMLQHGYQQPVEADNEPRLGELGGPENRR